MKIIYAILLTHFIFDWVLQPRDMAINKSSSFKWMVLHGTVLLAGFSILVPVYAVNYWLVVLYVLVHVLQDWLLWSTVGTNIGPDKFIIDHVWLSRSHPNPEYKEYMEHNKWAESYWFWTCVGFDQFLHLVVAVYMFTSLPVG